MKLILAGWMCHLDLELDLGAPVNLITGPNGAGKTAIRDAIEFLFLGTGELRQISTKKLLAEISISEGRDWCEVELHWGEGEEEIQLRRTMKRGGSQSVFKKLGEAMEDELPLSDSTSLIGMTDPDVIRLVLDPYGWFSLKETRQRELLLNATQGEKQTSETIGEALRKVLEPETDEARKAVTDISAHTAKHGFRQGQTKAEEKRQEAKRARTELKGDREVPPSEFDGVKLDEIELETAEQRLEQRRRQREEALVRESVDLGILRGQAGTEFEELQRLLGVDLPNADTEAAPDLNAVQHGLEEAEKAHQVATTTLGEADETVRTLKARIDAIDATAFEKPKQCPALTAPMKCPVGIAKFREAIKAGTDEGDFEIHGELETAEQMVQEARETVDKRLQTVEKWREDLGPAQERNRLEEARATDHKAHHEKVDAQEKRVTNIDAEVKAAEQNEVEKEGPTADELSIMITKGQGVVEAKRAYDQARDSAEKRDARLEVIELEVELWNSIAQQLKPEGIETTLGGGASSEFAALLAPMAPMTGELILDETNQIRVGPEKRHVLQLSHSYRRAVGIALQVAFARRTNFPVLVCDAVDRFRGPLKPAWMNCMMSLDPFPGGIIGMSALDKAPTATPLGTVNHYLDSDQIRTLEA